MKPNFPMVYCVSIAVHGERFRVKVRIEWQNEPAIQYAKETEAL
jgi:hypothetical protein